jgi:hypothetical protein
MGNPGQAESLQGTLPMLIAGTVATRANHGLAIVGRSQSVPKLVLRIERSLSAALHRSELDGLVGSYWDTTVRNREAKDYRLKPYRCRE